MTDFEHLGDDYFQARLTERLARHRDRRQRDRADRAAFQERRDAGLRLRMRGLADPRVQQGRRTA